MAPTEFRAGRASVSGNGFIVQTRQSQGAWVVEFMSEPRTSPEPLWFHVTCEGAGSRPVRFVWLNAMSCLGLGSQAALEAVRPVVQTDGGPWQRVGNVHVKPRRPTGHVLTFDTPGACDRVSAAFCYPYAPADLDATLDAAVPVWKRQPIGLSGHGRLLPRLYCPPKPRPRMCPGAYVIARQHAGETPGSWVLDGLLRAVAEADVGDPIRQVEWWASPFVDLDGVVEGNYGKDALPWDFNRAWSRMPMRPEVLTIQRDMRAFARRTRPRMLLDLHGPGGAEKRFYQFLCRDGQPPEHRDLQKSFTPHLARHMPMIPADELALTPRYPSRWNDTETATAWAWHELDRTTGVSLETTYQALRDGPWLEPDDYRDIGRRVARAVAAWLLEG